MYYSLEIKHLLQIFTIFRKYSILYIAFFDNFIIYNDNLILKNENYGNF